MQADRPVPAPGSATPPALTLRRHQERKQVQERAQQAQVWGRPEQVPAQPEE